MADPSGIIARKLALRVLDSVLEQKHTLDQALDQVLSGNSQMEARDRAFVHQLAATTLRRLGHIDRAIKLYVKKPLPKSAHEARDILRLAAAQILFLDVPAHAAVDTSVNLAAKNRHPNVRRLKGLINAVARKIAANRDQLKQKAESDPLGNHPAWIRKSWLAHFSEETAGRVAASLLSAPPLDITPKDPASATDLAKELAAEVLKNGSLRLPGSVKVTDLAGFEDGRWWVQDAAASLAVPLFGDISGHVIADLCAAPGGKTLQLAAMGAKSTKVIAVDSSGARLKRLHENLKRTGLSADVVTSDALHWRPLGGTDLDGILLDAPCSATGTLRRHPDVPYLRSPSSMADLAVLQGGLLAHAFEILRPGGTLIYSVCSLEKPEGRDQIEAFLAATPDAARKPITSSELPGMAEALTADGDVQTLPCHWANSGGMDGFFVARIIKND